DSNNLSQVCVDFSVRDGDRINHRDAHGLRILFMTTNSPSEKRLEDLRGQGWKEGVVPGKGVDVAGGPIPRKPGYYGQPVVKPPVWTWEVPLYFFFGGLAGMSAVITSAAVIFHHVDLARAAMWLAAIAGVVLSPVLLIMDLGRPRLFLNMLRVFKHRSAMSMGAWILSLFGACAVPGLIALELHAHQTFTGPLDQLLRLAAGLFIFGSAIFGTLLATYTGVLIGATAIPAWFSHRTLLPIHFGTAGLGSAAGLLELLGHRIAALNFLGYYAAGVESALLIWLSLDKQGAANRAIHEHGSGWLIRIGEVLNGPLAIVLRLFDLIPFSALSFLVGALVSRFGWIWVGKIPRSRELPPHSIRRLRRNLGENEVPAAMSHREQAQRAKAVSSPRARRGFSLPQSEVAAANADGAWRAQSLHRFGRNRCGTIQKRARRIFPGAANLARTPSEVVTAQ